VKAEAAALEGELPALSSGQVGAWSRRAAKAFAVEGVYSGLEAILKIIADEVDKGVPSGTAWHALLLEVMVTSKEGVRPQVLSEETFALLDQLRRFRHVARNNYALDLDEESIDRNLTAMRAVLPLFERDLRSFEAALLKD
jgi:hypothetical protein